MAGAAVDPDHADHVQDQVLGADAVAQCAVDGDRQRLRLALQQALRGQHVADFRGADAERQRAERAMRRGVAVAADDGHARLGDAEFRADHVHDAAVRAAEVEQFDAEGGRVLAQLRHLRLRFRVRVGQLAGRIRGQGGRRMVERALGALGPGHRQATRGQFGERLRRGHLVDQVQVHVQHRRRGVGLGADQVRVPQLVEQGTGRHHAASTRGGARRMRSTRLATSSQAIALASSTSRLVPCPAMASPSMRPPRLASPRASRPMPMLCTS